MAPIWDLLFFLPFNRFLNRSERLFKRLFSIRRPRNWGSIHQLCKVFVWMPERPVPLFDQLAYDLSV